MSTKAGTMGFAGSTGAVHVLDRGRVRSRGRGADPERGGTQRGGSRRSIRDERGRQRYPRGGEHRGPAVGRGQARGHGGPCARRDRSVQGAAPLWDAGKLEAMEGRVLAETVRPKGAAPLWDAGKLQAMEGRVLAG